MILSTQLQGKITELAVANEFLKLGYTVSQPLVDDRYDFIVDIKGELKKIQVKTSHLGENNEYFEFKTCNTHTNTQGTTQRNYKNDNIDYFATMYNNKCYIIPVSQCGVRSQRLRLQPTKNGQTKGITFAENYELEKIFPND